MAKKLIYEKSLRVGKQAHVFTGDPHGTCFVLNVVVVEVTTNGTVFTFGRLAPVSKTPEMHPESRGRRRPLLRLYRDCIDDHTNVSFVAPFGYDPRVAIHPNLKLGNAHLVSAADETTTTKTDTIARVKLW